MTPPRRCRRLLAAAGVVAAGTFAGCSDEPTVEPTAALRALCGDDVRIEEEDPGVEDGFNQPTVGQGRTELLAAECPAVSDDTLRAARYDDDPTVDMVDMADPYVEADGISTTWAILEPTGPSGGDWVVVWAGTDSRLEPLEPLGFELVSSEGV